MHDFEFRKHFASDNNSAAIPEIIEAMQTINKGHFPSYGADPITEAAYKEVKRVFGDCDVYFVFNGTAANVLALQAMLRPYHSVICAETSHLHESECGAPEKLTGAKLQLCPSSDGKISVKDAANKMVRLGDQHSSQPKVISITQPTEYGTVYTLEEIKALRDFADQNDLYLHIDGSRLVNAAICLEVEPHEICQYADIVSLGGTKNGLMGAEAVLIFNGELKKDFKFIRKQSMQLAGKMRFLSIQFIAWLQNDTYKRYAQQSVSAAKQLAKGLSTLRGVEITQKVETNSVFVKMPRTTIKKVREKFFFYVWNEQTWECRLMTSFDTSKEDIDAFLNAVKESL